MRILIVGGGIAGFSMARALELKGYQADLVERRPDEASGDSGLFLPGNAGRALKQLGLLDRVQSAAAVIRTQSILDKNGRQLSVTQTQDVWGSCGPCLSLPRAGLHGILRQSLSRTQLRFGLAVETIKLSATTCQVSFSDGSSSTYDIVIGADGIGSSVRGMLFPAINPTYVGNVSWRFITRNTTAIDSWTAMLGHRKALLAIPVNANDIYVYADTALAFQDIQSTTAQASLPALFKDFSGPILPLITQIPEGTLVHFSKIEQVVMDDWVKGRVVLIGDAAHAASPSMAQNAGMALEDALVLAESIAAAGSPDDALATYTAKRRHRVEWTQKQCAARDKMRAWPTPMRNAVLKVLGNRLYARSYSPLAAPFD